MMGPDGSAVVVYYRKHAFLHDAACRADAAGAGAAGRRGLVRSSRAYRLPDPLDARRRGDRVGAAERVRNGRVAGVVVDLPPRVDCERRGRRRVWPGGRAGAQCDADAEWRESQRPARRHRGGAHRGRGRRGVGGRGEDRAPDARAPRGAQDHRRAPRACCGALHRPRPPTSRRAHARAHSGAADAAATGEHIQRLEGWSRCATVSASRCRR